MVKLRSAPASPVVVYILDRLEALRLRVHDLDFQRLQITVRHGKGGKDRRTMLPSRVAEKLKFHLEEVRSLHRQDLAEGYG